MSQKSSLLQAARSVSRALAPDIPTRKLAIVHEHVWPGFDGEVEFGKISELVSVSWDIWHEPQPR